MDFGKLIKEALPFLAALIMFKFADQLILNKAAAHLENLIEGE